MNYNHKFILISILLFLVVIISILFLSKNDSVQNQDLVIKCEQIYNLKSKELEKTRYFGKKKDSMIFSKKTNSCLGYYYITKDTLSFEDIPNDFFPEDLHIFEVWDYSNDDLVLSAKTYKEKNSCTYNGSEFLMGILIYKYDKKLEGKDCLKEVYGLQDKKYIFDALDNFDKAMLDLGFKK